MLDEISSFFIVTLVIAGQRGKIPQARSQINTSIHLDTDFKEAHVYDWPA